MSNSLSGKVVIITGASSGIGAASARLLAEHGCKLALGGAFSRQNGSARRGAISRLPGA